MYHNYQLGRECKEVSYDMETNSMHPEQKDVISPEEVAPQNRQYIIILDPYNTHYDDFKANRQVYTFEQARKVALSLAAKNPSKKFYVARLVGSASVSNPVYQEV